ncbi:MAG: hypothetical protein ACK40O_08100 [Allosphingosinicella sp.]
MLAGLLGLALLAMTLFPETPLARTLHLYLVELPLRMAGRVERSHIILLVFLLVAGQGLVLIGSAELALAYAVDLSLYADAVLATTLAAAAARVRTVWWTCRSTAARIRRRPAAAARAPDQAGPAERRRSVQRRRARLDPSRPSRRLSGPVSPPPRSGPDC